VDYNVDYAITNTNPNPRNFLKFVEIEMEEDVGGQQAATWRHL